MNQIHIHRTLESNFLLFAALQADCLPGEQGSEWTMAADGTRESFSFSTPLGLMNHRCRLQPRIWHHRIELGRKYVNDDFAKGSLSHTNLAGNPSFITPNVQNPCVVEQIWR